MPPQYCRSVLLPSLVLSSPLLPSITSGKNRFPFRITWLFWKSRALCMSVAGKSSTLCPGRPPFPWWTRPSYFVLPPQVSSLFTTYSTILLFYYFFTTYLLLFYYSTIHHFHKLFAALLLFSPTCGCWWLVTTSNPEPGTSRVPVSSLPGTLWPNSTA